MRSTRMKRTDDLVRRVISEALLTKVSDPRIGLVSVTGVRVSTEFDTARVWVSVLGDEHAREETMRGLRSAARFLQFEVAKQIRMRRTPKLRFLYDETLDRGLRVDATLRELHGEPETSDPEDDEPEEEEDDDLDDAGSGNDARSR